MGRVSKHKKIKSCDPFYKGPRVNPVRKGDLPPDNDDDQPPPKSFLRFLRYNEQFVGKKTSSKATPTRGSKFKRKEGGASAKSVPNIADGASVPGGCKDVLGEPSRGTSDVPLPEGRAAMFVRKPGESMQTYLERIDFESKNRIVDCFRKERKTSGRRKQYLLERKKKLKSRKRKRAESDFDAFKDEVKFGEVVQAPPRLSAKPRGFEKKSKKTPKLEPLPNPDHVSTHKLSTGGLKRQKDIEEERVKVISKYREVKAARLKERTAC